MNAFSFLPQGRALRIGIALAVIFLSIALALFLAWFTVRGLFSKNPRFALKNVSVQSTGWWRGRSSEVSKILKLKPGSTNLFDLNLRQLRERIEIEPSVEKASVARGLPDTLVVEITERIPRAFINSPKSIWVLDGSGFVMAKDTCVNLDSNLPVIMFKSSQNIRAGMRVESIEPALELLSLARTEYRDVRIAAINLYESDEIVFSLYYKNNFNDIFRVYMPRENMRFLLKALVTGIEQVRATNDSRRTISLLYNGQIVLK